MFIISLILFLLIFSCRYLVLYIQKIRTGDPNESNLTYWMFSYDFKPENKEWVPEDKELLKRKRNRKYNFFRQRWSLWYTVDPDRDGYRIAWDVQHAFARRWADWRRFAGHRPPHGWQKRIGTPTPPKKLLPKLCFAYVSQFCLDFWGAMQKWMLLCDFLLQMYLLSPFYDHWDSRRHPEVFF